MDKTSHYSLFCPSRGLPSQLSFGIMDKTSYYGLFYPRRCECR